MAKIEMKQVELKRREKRQDMADAGAFAMQFAVPFNCCQDDRDILKALNKAQADRIEHLEDEIIAYKKQQDVDLAIKKDLDEKLDKATADYRALWVENKDLTSQLAGAKAQCENTVENRRRISELSQEVIDLIEQQKDAIRNYTALENENDRLTKTIRDIDERNKTLREQLKDHKDHADYLESVCESLTKDVNQHIERLKKARKRLANANESSKGMQSKIAKQANEIRRLTEENETLHKALDIAAKDAEANFERGKIKGMTEIWDELKDCYDGCPIRENQKIFGYHTVGDMLMNLSPTWFINKAEEYHKQEEKKARDIQIGDEVEIFDQYDHSLSDIGIVIAIDKDNPCFAVIGPNFEGCFDETDIQNGNVKKTGQHFDSIPLDYFA